MTARAAGYAGERRAGAHTWRHQLPVSSPVSWAALAGGLRAVLSGTRARRDHEAVTASLVGRFGASAALLTDSGTSALAVAIAGALRERPGTAVAIPAFACYDIATAVSAAGVPALLYDVDPQSLTPDLASVERAVRHGAGAIVVAHLYGYPSDLAEVLRIGRDAGAVVIEDAAQAVGATVRGRLAGTQAPIGVLSFGRGKGWTGGGGGALLAFDELGVRVADRARAGLRRARRGWGALAALGVQHLVARPEMYAVPAALPFLRLGETVYRAPHPPRGLARASGGVLPRTQALADSEIAVRRRNAERLMVALRGDARSELQVVSPQPGAMPNYLRLPVLTPPGTRSIFCDRHAARLGIAPSYPRPLSKLPVFAPRCGNAGETFSGALELALRLCTLPTHSWLSNQDLAEVVSWIQTVRWSA
jgi:dTDP-4-amino-4,6-dideoxygalactose transaminase